MSMSDDYKREIVDIHKLVGTSYKSRYSEIFEKLDRLCDIPTTGYYENNPFLKTAYRGLHDTGLS